MGNLNSISQAKPMKKIATSFLSLATLAIFLPPLIIAEDPTTLSGESFLATMLNSLSLDKNVVSNAAIDFDDKLAAADLEDDAEEGARFGGWKRRRRAPETPSPTE